MASNVVVRPYEPDSWFYLICLCAIISCLAKLCQDEKAEEERCKQMVLYMQQAFSQALDVVAGSLASGLNSLLQHITYPLQAAGLKVGLPFNTVTPEGVTFVAQWVLLLLICYGVLTIAFRLVTLFVRWLWWQVKVAVALACFGLILKDHKVGIETMVIRLVCLGCVCMLLGIRSWKDRTMAARIVHLEELVNILENQLKNQVRVIESWRRRCTILSCCLIGLLSLVFLIVFIVFTIISNS